MIDINLYRYRIGTYSTNTKSKKPSYINEFSSEGERKGKNVLLIIQFLLKFLIIWGLFYNWTAIGHLKLHIDDQLQAENIHPCPNQVGVFRFMQPFFKLSHFQQSEYIHPFLKRVAFLTYMVPLFKFSQPIPVIGKKMSSNFRARYKLGNKQCPKGIKNIHLNIRSL